MASLRSRFKDLPTVEVKGRRGPALRRLAPGDPPAGLDHRLVAGETLDLLARRYYGDESLWWRIADANPARPPGALVPGDLLRIPAPAGRGGR